MAAAGFLLFLTASTVRTSTTRTPTLFARQRELLRLLDALGGTAGKLDFQLLLFLYCHCVAEALESEAGEHLSATHL